WRAAACIRSGHLQETSPGRPPRVRRYGSVFDPVPEAVGKAARWAHLTRRMAGDLARAVAPRSRPGEVYRRHDAGPRLPAQAEKPQGGRPPTVSSDDLPSTFAIRLREQGADGGRDPPATRRRVPGFG